MRYPFDGKEVNECCQRCQVSSAHFDVGLHEAGFLPIPLSERTVLKQGEISLAL